MSKAETAYLQSPVSLDDEDREFLRDDATGLLAVCDRILETPLIAMILRGGIRPVIATGLISQAQRSDRPASWSGRH